jgi:chorismate--pyruvate lyase
MKRNRWRTRLPRWVCEAGLASWLVETGSLTARCIRLSRSFRVRLLYSGPGRPLADEGLALPGSGAPARVREVLLECDGVPVIFAHTTLAAAGKGRLGRWLAGLGSRSLGSLLFAHPGFRRGPIEFLRLDSRHELYRRAAPFAEAAGRLWARRSWHELDGERVLVTEVFLPAVNRLGRRG